MPKASDQKIVLIIDDDKDIQLFLASLMTHRGFKPLCAENRTDGWNMAASEHPDCIILNCMLCGEDGISLYKTLKTDKMLQAIPVVMLSAVGKEIMLQHWMFRGSGSAGAIPEPDAFVASPPDGDVIVNWVDTLTRTGGAQ